MGNVKIYPLRVNNFLQVSFLLKRVKEGLRGVSLTSAAGHVCWRLVAVAERAVGTWRNVVMRECFKTIKMKCTVSCCCCILRNLFHCECASCAYFYGYILCAVIA